MESGVGVWIRSWGQGVGVWIGGVCAVRLCEVGYTR